MIKLVSKYNGIIRKVRRLFKKKDSLHTIYNTIVLLYLSYCTFVWGDKNNYLDSLFITQKKIIRTCTNSIWLEHTTPLFLSIKDLKPWHLYSSPCRPYVPAVAAPYFFGGGASRGQNAFLRGQKSKNLPKMADFDNFFFWRGGGGASGRSEEPPTAGECSFMPPLMQPLCTGVM